MKGKKKATGNSDSVPPPEVLGLVGSFFTQYGLESTNKAFAKELKRLQQTADWPAASAAETVVDLQSAFLNWVEEQHATKNAAGQKTQPAESTSESDDTTSDSESTSASSSSSSDEESDDSSSVSSEVDSSSDETSTSEDQIKRKSTQKPQKNKAQKRAASPSSSSSSSDSDADDEDEDEATIQVKSTSSKKKSKTPTEPTEAVVKKDLKRKAELSSSESSSSASVSDSSDDDRPAKRAKMTTKAATNNASSSETSSSSSAEESDEEENAGNSGKLTNGTKPVSVQEASSESSGTVMGDNMDVDKLPTSEDASERTPRSTAPLTKKHTGARPTPLAQLSAHATADSHISNAYQSYDYAERAYQDLSVTRGKGFTKEKNKKKRGSYRGGAIDISGGKGFKFDD